MDNYPPGTWAHDPDAPWNRPDAGEGETCATCRFANWVSEAGGFCLYGPLAEQVNEIGRVRAGDDACEAWEAL